ncbi:DUF2142 domain-containing protein [Methanobrevibacter sp.]|uniref:DUF2142 domain-containing protein n=1 Tax=Methanobrevibacter sp. TaxID=66852 RepID=UPI00388EF852
MDVKNYFNDYKKYMLIYIVFVIVFLFAMYNEKLFADYQYKVIFLLITTIIGLTSIYYAYKNKMELHKIGLVLIIIFGLMMVFLAPPMSFPDEATHFTRAELMSEGHLYPNMTENGVYVNNYYFNMNQAQNGATIINHDFNNPITDHKGYWEYTTDSPFYSYILSALGILLAKILNLTEIWALYFARIANLLLYGIVAFFMIRTIPKFKLPLLIIATMPLCLSQASSPSYDAFILTFSLIIITYFIKMYCDEINRKNLAVFFISILLISLIKPPYVILAFLTLILPYEESRHKKYSLIIALLLIVLTMISVSSIFVSFADTAPASTVSRGGQLQFIISQPQVLINLAKNIIVSIPDLLIMKSNYFHYADFEGYKLFNILYILSFLVFSLFYKLDVDLEKNKRIILSIIFLIIYIGIYGILYLQWTPVGSNVILGVQTRYFLPIIFMIPLIINLKNKKIENKDMYVLTFIIIFLTGLMMLPITHYY